MKEKGATVYLTWDEYSAIHEALDNISTQCHSADNEYVESVESTISNLQSIIAKFQKSRANSGYKRMLLDSLSKHGMSAKEAKEAIKNYKNEKS